MQKNNMMRAMLSAVAGIALFFCLVPTDAFAASLTNISDYEEGTALVQTTEEDSEEVVEKDSETAKSAETKYKAKKKTVAKKTFKVKGKKYVAAVYKTTPAYTKEETTTTSLSKDKQKKMVTYEMNSMHAASYQGTKPKIKGYKLEKAEITIGNTQTDSSDSKTIAGEARTVKTDTTEKSQRATVKTNVKKKIIKIKYQIVATETNTRQTTTSRVDWMDNTTTDETYTLVLTYRKK